MAQAPERAAGKNAGAAPAKRKRAINPELQIMGGGVKMGESRTLVSERGSEREHVVKRVDSTVNEGRFQGGKGGQARRVSPEQEERSMSE